MDDIQVKVNEMKSLSITNNDFQHLKESLETKVSMDEFNEQMKEKASKSSVSTALHRKANKNDIELALSQKVDSNTLSTIELSLSNKVDIDSFESAINKVQDGRVERVELHSLKEMIYHKCEKSAFDTLLKDHNHLHGDIQNKHSNLTNNLEDLEYKCERRQKSIETNLESKADSSSIKDSLDKVITREKLTSDTFDRIYSRIETLDNKLISCASVDEVREALKDIKSEQIDKIVEIRDDINKLDKYKAGVDATNEALALKADASLVENSIHLKASSRDYEILKDRVDQLYHVKLDNEKYESLHKKIISGFEEMSKDIGLKSNIKDVCKLLDLKANTN